MLLVWVGFFAVIAVLLAIDLGLVNRDSHVITLKEASVASVVWISIGLSFSGVVYLAYEFHWGGLGISSGGFTAMTGADATWQYLAGYLIEKSLSVDNIFVMAMLFSYFKVPERHQHKVLFWGIVGAVLLRGVMIGIGAALVRRFSWVFYVFGVFLIFTAIRMLSGADEAFDPDKSRIVRWARKLLPLKEEYVDDKFTVVEDGKRYVTLLLLVVIVIEATDVVFAVDSIPAIFGFTEDPFIVMTSNIFAILGLRALYFVVASAMREFHYLNLAVSTILILVGVKMLLHHTVYIAPLWSLAGVVVILTAGVWASIVRNRRLAEAAPSSRPDSSGDPSP